MGKFEHEEIAFRKSIEKKSLPDLKDLLARQNAILANQKLIDKLPDKGAKVQLKKAQIEKLIESRGSTVHEASELLQAMAIQSGNSKTVYKSQTYFIDFFPDLIDVDAMEWKLGGSGYKSMTKSVEPQTENEEMLRLVASKEVPNKKDVEQYALEMALKIDEKKSHNMENAPFKTVKKAELDESAKEKIPLKRQENKDGIKSRKVEVMPLPPANYERLRVQPIDLTESLKLQKEHSEKLKALQLKQAVWRLTNAENVPVKTLQSNDSSKMNYREERDDTDEEEDQEENVPDSDDDSD